MFLDLLMEVSHSEVGILKRKAGELLFSMPISEDLMSSEEDSRVRFSCSVKLTLNGYTTGTIHL
jgi:hypothetical protein